MASRLQNTLPVRTLPFKSFFGPPKSLALLALDPFNPPGGKRFSPLCCSLEFDLLLLFSLMMLAPLELAMGDAGGGPEKPPHHLHCPINLTPQTWMSQYHHQTQRMSGCYHRLDQTKAQGLGHP